MLRLFRGVGVYERTFVNTCAMGFACLRTRVRKHLQWEGSQLGWFTSCVHIYERAFINVNFLNGLGPYMYEYVYVCVCV
jgi:hypothetical protein